MTPDKDNCHVISEFLDKGFLVTEYSVPPEIQFQHAEHQFVRPRGLPNEYSPLLAFGFEFWGDV
jgi:hypothetical protein